METVVDKNESHFDKMKRQAQEWLELDRNKTAPPFLHLALREFKPIEQPSAPVSAETELQELISSSLDGMRVLKTILDRLNLEMGSETAKEIISKLDKWLKEFASQSQSKPDTNTLGNSEAKIPTKRALVSCICGSGRFLKQMHLLEEELTLHGEIVLMIGVNTKDVARTKELEHYKPMLDELHLRKIDLADRVFVVSVNAYVGESTRKEIVYAFDHHKPVIYRDYVQEPKSGEMKEVRSEDELDLMQYVTNLLYAAYSDGANNVKSPQFDKWVHQMIEQLDMYYAQFTKTEQRQVEITDEEIHDKAIKECKRVFPGISELKEEFFISGFRICAKWMREQGKGIDLREELVNFVEWNNAHNGIAQPVPIKMIDNYLSKIKTQ